MSGISEVISSKQKLLLLGKTIDSLKTNGRCMCRLLRSSISREIHIYISKDPWAGRKPSMAVGLKQDGKFLRDNFDVMLARGF
jgi:hypothetical protein